MGVLSVSFARIMGTSSLFLLLCSLTGSLATFTDQPRLQTVDGHLFIYGGSDKNVTLMTTNKGYVNINGENLYNLVQEAKTASQLFKGMKYTAVSKIEEDMKFVLASLDIHSQRLNACEAILTAKTKDRSTFPVVSLLNSRVTKLERRVRRISRNLMRNECRRDPCLNGGTCLDRYLGYECKCPEGWEGKKCDKDVNECAKFAGTDLGCQNGATCYNTRGSYECHCAPGWHGLHCLRRTNDCSSGSAAELCGHGICVSQANDPRGYTCICSQGWTTDGVSRACTVDVDECATAPCSRNPPVLCHNAPGSFFCGPCPPGYTGNGFQCTDVDECQIDNGGCSTQPMVNCINTFGSSTCGSCPPGYSGDGRTCTYVGKCHVDNGGCHPNARCIELGSNVQCQCLPGYTGYGIGPFGCEAISGPISTNLCQSNPCKNGGRCYPTSATNFTCACLPGFAGPTCSVVDFCDRQPCQNGGTCEARGNTFRCKCPRSFRGTYCEDRKEECGEYLRAEEGVLKFPEENSGSSSAFSCAWVIRVNVTRVINITFNQFELRNSFECQLEWLEIHDGRSTGDVTIGKFCGEKLPNNGTILTTQNFVYIWFKSTTLRNSKFELNWKSVEPTCGGAVNASIHGVVTSPGYPGKYPNDRDCYWEVTTSIGKRIMFTIFEMRLNSAGSCINDYVEIHEGLSLDSPLLVKFCNTSSPEIIETPGNTALIYFHTDHRGTEKGFQMAYHPKPGHPGCGGVFTTLRGEITPPTRNGLYLPNMDCSWVIRLPEERRIKIEFTNFSLQNSRNCRDDFLEVRDGGDITAPLFGKFCGSQIPPPITSNHKTMLIRFYTDEIVERSGFQIQYKSVCDEILTAPSGVIRSPGYPSTYKSEEECVIIIEQPPGKIINLEFQEFEIESTYRCIFDYVEIRDGHDENSPLIGRYCGSNRPGSVISTHNYLYLKMVTDNNVELAGFYGNYSTVDVSCGGIHTAPSGVINSPVEEDHYPSNTYCKWVIAVKPGQLIQLTFVKLKVEGFNACLFDYVAVYDNSTTIKGNNLIGRYCRYNMPPVLTSAGNVLTIVFSSDSTFTDEGFSATYTAINGSSICGGKFFTEWGVIKTPNYPDFYPSWISCNWVIRVKNGHKISLNISDFYLERPYSYGGKKCKFDYLEIRDGGYSSSPLIGRYCGTDIPKQIISQGNNLYLEFVSDAVDSARGFQIFWDGSIKGCGGILTGPKGSIISPNYPDKYGSILNCVYRISISHGSRIQLNFIDLELKSSKGCFKEYLEVFDGIDQQSKSFGKFCTLYNAPPGITSSGNHLTVVFKSGLGSSGKGFYLKYFTVCRANITGYRGIIESPNYPDNYPTSLNCLWSIRAPEGNKIRVSFTHFNMRSSCRNAYLEVSDEDPEKSTAVNKKKYCRNNITMALESTQESLHLRLVTSDYPVGGNFRLEWAVKGCGGYLTKPSGTFTTPNYPNVYPASVRCEWWITVDPLKSITLVFSDVSFEPNEHCSFDGVEVYGGPDNTSPLLTKICTVMKDDVIVTSSGNQMYISFYSDMTNVARGFKANYFTTAGSCGGVFQSRTGTIHSRNYPKNYQMDDCEWKIQVDVNHRINLTFESFDLFDDGNCTSAYVEVYDGLSTSRPPVWRHCGNHLPQQKTVISTSENLTVRMRVMNATYTAKGFLASYKMICGGVVNADSPGIIQGGSNLKTVGGENCTWVLYTAETDGHVILTLSHVDFNEYDPNECFNERLLVFNGQDSSNNSSLVGTYCLASTPLPIVSRGNDLSLVFIFGYSDSAEFQVSYTSASSACGGELSSQRGLFASPNYPDSYPPNSECIWTLLSAPGNRIQLNFQVFDVGISENCNDEYVEIRDSDSVGKLVGVYCGSDSPGNLTAHNALWVKFKSRVGGTGTMRFLADYSLVYGNEINGSSGQIASPGYPRLFSSVTPVSWRIIVGFRKYILIQFKDLYLNSVISSECQRSVTIYNGFDDTAPVLIKKCDAELPDSPIISSSNIVYIVLDCYPLSVGGRFFLDWRETKTKVEVPIAPTSSPLPGCGGEFVLTRNETNHLTISVPGAKEKPYSDMTCIWKISCPEEEHLAVSIESYDLKSFADCDFSYIQISTDLGGTWKNLVRVCENMELNSTYNGHSVLLIKYYNSWPSNASPASLLVTTECGGSIKNTNGIIDFDWRNYPHSHSIVLRHSPLAKYSCQWDITVTPGRTIRTTLIDFDGMNSNDGICQDNFFSLRNGGTEDSPYLGDGSYCSAMNVVPQTTSNKLFIKVFASYHFYGFTLMYEEVPHSCGGEFTLDDKMNSTTISSPNYPNIPPMKVECIWRFVAAGVRRLQIDFLDRFDLAISSGCTQEYVSVRDGGTDLSNEIGHYCEDKPSSVKTTGNMMYVKYYTNTTDPQNGFRARISLDRCGGIITSSSGVITSPGYPNSYSYHTECRWEIETNTISTLKITFEDVDLPQNYSNTLTNDNTPMTLDFIFSGLRTRYLHLNGSNCTSLARITIKEPQVRNSNRIDVPTAVICTNGPTEAIQTSTNKVIITFDSAAWDVGHYFVSPRGFKLNFTSVRAGCLHNLFTESGVIETRNIPIGQWGFFNCEWRITVPRGRRVSVRFDDIGEVDKLYLMLGLTHTPFTAYNDHYYRSQIGPLIPTKDKIYKSTSNLMTISYISNSDDVLKFRMIYDSNEPAACGGNVSDSSGYIESPKNFSSFYCPWYFTYNSKENQTLAVTVYDSVIGNRTGTCNSRFGNFLLLRAKGESVDHHAVLCGNVSSRTIRTPFTRATLTGVKSLKVFGDMKFKVKYKTSPCGGILTGSEFVITSPSYPGNYPSDIDCAWLINVPFDATVKMTFEELRLNAKNDCEDYLTIKNGPNLDSPTIERFCGILLEAKPVISETSSVLIEFHSTNSSKGDSPGRRFKLKVEAVDSACGGIIHAQDTEITSPHFPKPYGNNEECEWEIRAKEGMHIGLVFQERFHIEKSTDCKKDFLQVFDYVNEEWKSVKKICGREFPAPINSTTNRMKIIFRSDSTTTSDGFKAKWFSNCGAVYENIQSGRIVSPAYPDRYPSNIRCEYVVHYSDMAIDFRFTNFNLEKGDRGLCVYDYVEFYMLAWDGEYKSEGKFCGSTVPAPLSIFKEAKIVFSTDTYANNNGFELLFSVNVCGGLITKPTRVAFNCDSFFMESDCQWNISAPADKIVVLRFTKVRISASRNCGLFSLTVVEYNETGSPVPLATICGNLDKDLPVIHSRSRNVTVLASGVYLHPKCDFSFTVSFTYGEKQGCGGSLSLNSNPETITSPDMDRDGNYEDLMDCSWLILAKPFHYITANFLSLDVDNCGFESTSGNCSCDYVELRNGIDPHSEVLLTACGSALPPPVVSSGNAMALHMVTDAATNRKGFAVQFSSLLSSCGYGFLNATMKPEVLTSPNYPEKYPLGIRCKWVLSDFYNLSGVRKNVIHVHLLEWDLEEGDSIRLRSSNEVMGGTGDAAERLSQPSYVIGKGMSQLSFSYINPYFENDRMVTGKGKSLDYYALSRQITIDFVSKGTTAKKGFKLEYSLAGCTRNYSSDHGQIVMVYQNSERCVVLIEAPTDNHTISLYFFQLQMQYTNSSCPLSYIEVRDGQSNDSPVIRKLCGWERPHPIYSSGRYLRLNVVINVRAHFLRLQQDIFDVTYTTTDKGKGCGGRVSAMRGVIFSPEYPKNVRKNKICRWDITVPPGLDIIIKFNNFDIGASITCETDNLKILDVNADGSENTRSSYCGGNTPAEIRSGAPAVAIVYRTSVHNSGTGWELEYRLVTAGAEAIY